MRIKPGRARKIFGNPVPPENVWERQFDGFDSELRHMACQAPEDIDPEDLWYYFHDLSFVELQRDLFNHLFPVCLDYWYTSLMQNESASIGDAEFHYSMYRGNILEKMLSTRRQQEVSAFFCDGFMDRIEAEREFHYSKSSTPAYAWIQRFNSLGYVVPIIDTIWTDWWTLDHPGKAVSAIMYASGLIYAEGENPIFGEWSPDEGGGGPYLAESDTYIYDAGWLPDNLRTLENILSVSYIQERISYAAARLASEPEAAVAEQVANDAARNSDIIQIQLDDLLENLAKAEQDYNWLE